MINIEDLIPLLRKGWVAMDEDGAWWWFENEPEKIDKENRWFPSVWGEYYFRINDCIAVRQIAPVKDWKMSLRKVG